MTFWVIKVVCINMSDNYGVIEARAFGGGGGALGSGGKNGIRAGTRSIEWG